MLSGVVFAKFQMAQLLMWDSLCLCMFLYSHVLISTWILCWGYLVLKGVIIKSLLLLIVSLRWCTCKKTIDEVNMARFSFGMYIVCTVCLSLVSDWDNRFLSHFGIVCGG